VFFVFFVVKMEHSERNQRPAQAHSRRRPAAERSHQTRFASDAHCAPSMNVNNPEELFARQLGEMMTAETTFIQGMREMEQKVQEPKLKQSIQAHIRQTETQVENLRKAFQKLGKEPQNVECIPAKGLVEAFRKQSQEIPQGGGSAPKNVSMIDNVAAMNAANVEHYEIGAYRGLIASAQKLGKNDVVPILQENLRMEETQAKQVEDMMQRLP
jgi:ferritin-like metal-binding protein YciE